MKTNEHEPKSLAQAIKFINDEERSLKRVRGFISGYQMGRYAEDDPEWFACFQPWVSTRYERNAPTRSGFTLIREKVGGDDSLAAEEFFRLLPDYERDMREIGAEGILARHHEWVIKWMANRERT